MALRSGVELVFETLTKKFGAHWVSSLANVITFLYCGINGLGSDPN